ncbi:hypothetical protein DFJ63DRAFT_290820 [Scheffersomyces coipomensis]|uniref:uncharacterized protein n=1 Tax=Scheffersomyces coipomensis TaxID=1788519 RepID=UPI00315D4E4C
MPSIDVCPLCVKKPLEKSTKVSDISWLQCDICKQWFHSVCLKLPQIEINNIHSYHCDKCKKHHGESVFKRKSKRSRIKVDYAALNDGDTFLLDKTFHPHVSTFLDYPIDANAMDEKNNPYLDILDNLTKSYGLTSQLKKPILIPQVDIDIVGMTFAIPKEKITIDYITDKVGDEESVEVMDVLSQQGVHPGWNMGKWRDYFNTDELSRDRIRNVISLEISQVKQLGQEFSRPTMVNEMDLVDKVWDQTDEQPRSQVTKYCLMSVKNSFTDFHIDFGGTSVYYTVCKGSKTFLMYPPTDENLELYKTWCLEPNQNFMWFGDYSSTINGKRLTPNGGFKATLKEGDLFIIPSGWIHSVFTPEDSIVIGGNYLTLKDMKTQLKISNIERDTKVPPKFKFPMFNKVLWLTSWYYLNHKQEYVRDLHPEVKSEVIQDDNSLEYTVLSSLIDKLKSHYELSKTSQIAKKSIPTKLIGKDIDSYLGQLQSWLGEYTTTTT